MKPGVESHDVSLDIDYYPLTSKTIWIEFK